jgi:hypothetical protein
MVGLLEAAHSNNTSQVKQALACGENVHTRGWQGETALHWAATYANSTMTIALLEAGANIKMTDDKGDKPFDWAVGSHRDNPPSFIVLLIVGLPKNSSPFIQPTPVDTQQATLCNFLISAGDYIKAENRELRRIRRETFSYCYGKPIIPFILTFAIDGPNNATLDIALWLGSQSIIKCLPTRLQEAISIVILLYTAYKRFVSTIAVGAVSYGLSKAINSLEWPSDKAWLKHELIGLLLIMVEYFIPRVRKLKELDAAFESTIRSAKDQLVVGVKSFFFKEYTPADAFIAADSQQQAVTYCKCSNTNLYSESWENRSDLERQWLVHKGALIASNAVYGDKVPKGFELIHTSITCRGLVLKAYRYLESNVVYFAYKGTTNGKDVLSDVLLAITGKPGSFEPGLAEKIANWAEEHPGIEVILTGHSLGAALASQTSLLTKLPAIVFENTGLRGNEDETLDYVISYQSTWNFINKSARWLANIGSSESHYGGKINLPSSSNTVDKIISAIPLLRDVWSHRMRNVNAAFEKHYRKRFEKGPERRETYYYELPSNALELEI